MNAAEGGDEAAVDDGRLEDGSEEEPYRDEPEPRQESLAGEPLPRIDLAHFSVELLLDVLFDQLRKGMSGFVCRTTVWEQNADKSIIFALEAAKVMPILPHSMTGMNNHIVRLLRRNFDFGNTKFGAFSKQSY